MAGESGAEERQRRRWSFAGCIFDEANWTLAVEGQRVVVEAKPLELLRELLLNAGNLVSKDQLMDKIWPDVEVVEASLPTAIAKLRRALGDDRRDRPVIETVSRRGYRLAVPVELEELPGPDQSPASATKSSTGANWGSNRQRRATDRAQGEAPGRERSNRTMLLVAALGIVAILVALAVVTANRAPIAGATTARTYSKTDVFTALRKVDIETMERMLAAGWDPNAALDADGNGALSALLNNCEWDPGHDQRQLLLAARTLIDGGAQVDDRNAWGDTPYSIAKAERYCGQDHPATKMIQMICYEGGNPIGDRCLADYKRDAAGKVIRQDPPQPAK